MRLTQIGRTRRRVAFFFFRSRDRDSVLVDFHVRRVSLSLGEEAVSEGVVAKIALAATPGTVLILAGLDSAMLRRLIDQVEAGPSSPRALFTQISHVRTTEVAVHQLLDQLAETALRLWPVWFTDLSFAEYGSDLLGRIACSAKMRRATAQIHNLQPAWVDAAMDLALRGRPPHVTGVVAAMEVAQLALTISRHGLVIIIDVEKACESSNPSAVVQALEWIAQHTECAVVALFKTLPPHVPPFDRILYGARILRVVGENVVQVERLRTANEGVWLSPWLGSPHPLSETEQRLEKALRADGELGPLFGCNQFVETVHGARPKVDFLWTYGRLVVELDGYGSHGNRAAFMYDRHRDYELTLSGYTVLRLANDEIAQDIGKAVEKIRDIVHVCRNRMN